MLADSCSSASCQEESEARAALNSSIGAEASTVKSAAAFKMEGKGRGKIREFGTGVIRRNWSGM